MALEAPLAEAALNGLAGSNFRDAELADVACPISGADGHRVLMSAVIAFECVGHEPVHHLGCGGSDVLCPVGVVGVG